MTNKLCTWSLLSSIASLVVLMFLGSSPIGIILGIILIVVGYFFGIKGLREVKNKLEKGKGFAIAGIIISSLAVLLVIFGAVVAIFLTPLVVSTR